MARVKPAMPMRDAHGYAKRMSDNVAIALVIYTLMLIFLVTPNMETKGMSILPYFLLVAMVGIVIPIFRRFEWRWTHLDGIELSRSGLDSRFLADRIKLWLVAIGVPVLLSLASYGLSTGF